MTRALATSIFLFAFAFFAATGDLSAAPGEVIITHASMSTTAIPLWLAQR
jgi:hypothetical protein